jgi:hypothetical protein
MKKWAVLTVKASTKDKLAQRVAQVLAPFDPENVIAVSYAVDFAFWWPFGPNTALIVLRTTAED